MNGYGMEEKIKVLFYFTFLIRILLPCPPFSSFFENGLEMLYYLMSYIGDQAFLFQWFCPFSSNLKLDIMSQFTDVVVSATSSYMQLYYFFLNNS